MAKGNGEKVDQKIIGPVNGSGPRALDNLSKQETLKEESMKKLGKVAEEGKMETKKELIMFMIAALVLFPVALYGQEQGGETADQITANSPPVEQPLVPEGLFAVELVKALKIGQAENEAQAENILSAIGIGPRNGWIAGYPVTPDIIGEIEISVAAAAEAKRLEMGKDQALEAVEDLVGRLGLNVTPAAANQAATGSQYAETPPSINYTPNNYSANPAPEVINNYYYSYGPPVVTYYAPPWPYYYLYVWVPYPFRCFRFFFPGFFILHDFHRTVIIHKKVFMVSNHVVDVRTKKVFVIDPAKRRHFGATVVVNRATSRPIFSSPSAKAGAQAIASLSQGGAKSARFINRPGPGNGTPPQSRNPSEGQLRPNRRVNSHGAMPSTINRGTTRNPARTNSSIVTGQAPVRPGTGERRKETKLPGSSPNEIRAFNGQRVSQPKNPPIVSAPPVTREQTFSRPGNSGTRNGVNIQRQAVDGSKSFRPPVASSKRSLNSPATNDRNSSRPVPPSVTTNPPVGKKEFIMLGNSPVRKFASRP